MPYEIHETKMQLMRATSDLMDEMSFEEISAAMVLERTGASKSSMYHFFEDFNDLLEETFLQRFALSVHTSDREIKEIIRTSSSSEEFLRSLEKVTKASQARKNSATRFQRARMLARSERNERFRISLGEIQQQLTDSLTQAFESAQDKGFLNRDFEARTGAVFIQAYTLGRVVDDITVNQMNDKDWEKLISRIAREVLGNS